MLMTISNQMWRGLLILKTLLDVQLNALLPEV